MLPVILPDIAVATISMAEMRQEAFPESAYKKLTVGLVTTSVAPAANAWLTAVASFSHMALRSKDTDRQKTVVVWYSSQTRQFLADFGKRADSIMADF